MARVWVKICGITNADDARQAEKWGADALGYNTYPRSPRCTSLDAAAIFAAQVALRTEAVVLVVNGDPRETAGLLRPWSVLSTVQWHGKPPLPSQLAPLRLIPAFSVRDRQSLDGIEQYLSRCRADGALPFAVLVDAHVPGQFGGTGRKAPWHLLADLQPGVPLILAGGLTPENVGEAIRTVRPFGVDVASGVERSPGVKDPDRVRHFIEEARDAAAGLP
jgi:phosphoribosylanthranilate isomerase